MSVPDTESSPPRQSAQQASESLCKNCGIVASGLYCPQCGQSTRVKRITLPGVIRSFVKRTLNLERGLLKTFWELTVSPTEVFQGYLAGKRVRYTNPIGYMLISMAVSVVAMRLFGGAMIDVASDDYATLVQTLQLNEEQVELLSHYMDLQMDWLSLQAFVWMLPVLVLVKALRWQLTWGEAWTFLAFMLGHATLLTTLAYLVLPIGFSFNTVAFLNLVILLLYFAYASHQFFQSYWRAAFVAIGATLSIAVVSGIVTAMTFIAVKLSIE